MKNVVNIVQAPLFVAESEVTESKAGIYERVDELKILINISNRFTNVFFILYIFDTSYIFHHHASRR